MCLVCYPLTLRPPPWSESLDKPLFDAFNEAFGDVNRTNRRRILCCQSSVQSSLLIADNVHFVACHRSSKLRRTSVRHARRLWYFCHNSTRFSSQKKQFSQCLKNFERLFCHRLTEMTQTHWITGFGQIIPKRKLRFPVHQVSWVIEWVSEWVSEWLIDWVRDFSLRASSAMGLRKKRNLAQG